MPCWFCVRTGAVPLESSGSQRPTRGSFRWRQAPAARAAIQDFVDRYGLGFTQLADLEGSVYTHFGITQQDTFVLVSADGDVETVDGYASDLDPQQLVADAFG